MKNVLIFPAGTEIGLEIFNALKYSKFIKIYGGTSVADHSEFVYKNFISGFPFVTEPDFLEFLNKVVEREKIDCVYPAHDSVCMFLGEHVSEIRAQVIITDFQTVKICRSKAETYRFFKGEGFIPKIYESAAQVEKFPVFVKPEIGQGSVGAARAGSRHELDEALRRDPSLVICEYLPGMEYTVDCFTDRHGELRVAKLRSRERIRTGISVRSRSLDMDDEIKTIASRINSKLRFRGGWFFQVKKDVNDEYRLLEISPRIPGTVGLSRNMGVNFALLTLFDFWEYDIEIIDNRYSIMLDRAFYSAYKIDYPYDTVYVDFDDTLIIDGKVNVDLMKLLYQARNEGKKIHLLSKHSGNIHDKLNEYGISKLLFESIVVISQEGEKKDYIKPGNAVLIDDSFKERKKICDEYGIPVFDVDMVEALIGWSAE